MKPWKKEAFARYGHAIFADQMEVLERLHLSPGPDFLTRLSDFVRSATDPFQVLARRCLETPTPLVGQVWADQNSELPALDGDWVTTADVEGSTVNECQIVLVHRELDGSASYRYFFDTGLSRETAAPARKEWPPFGAILVAGPGAPWMALSPADEG